MGRRLWFDFGEDHNIFGVGRGAVCAHRLSSAGLRGECTLGVVLERKTPIYGFVNCEKFFSTVGIGVVDIGFIWNAKIWSTRNVFECSPI